MNVQTIGITAEDIRIARWTVVVHRAEEWPAGTFCRNDHAVFPCPFRQWGHRTLVAAGWTENAIAALSHSQGQA